MVGRDMSDGSLEFSHVTVVGGGVMGSGIAQVCAEAGARVVLVDVDDQALRRARTAIEAFLDKGIEKGKTTPERKTEVLERLAFEPDLTKAAASAELVVEAVPENVDLKRELFARVAGAVSARTVLATNTSSLSLAEIFAEVPDRTRCLGTHFFNPPPLMKLLEIVRMSETSPAVLERVRAFAVRLGKEPIVVADSPGFATSRLGVALGLEAIRMVEAGVATPEDIDKAMELGYRHPMGPLRLTDLVGLDVRLAIADYLRRKLQSPVFEAPELLRRMVAEGRLGKKSGRGFYEW